MNEACSILALSSRKTALSDRVWPILKPITKWSNVGEN